MMHDDFRKALENLDVTLARKIWRHVHPNMPQPKTDEEALQTMHYARTVMAPIAFKLRAYSHCWLMERNLPSGLPDRLRPSAQRLYPVTVSAVGISVKGNSVIGRELAPLIRSAMEKVVNEAYADGKTEPGFLKKRMLEARDNEMRILIGRV